MKINTFVTTLPLWPNHVAILLTCTTKLHWQGYFFFFISQFLLKKKYTGEGFNSLYIKTETLHDTNCLKFHNLNLTKGGKQQRVDQVTMFLTVAKKNCTQISPHSELCLFRHFRNVFCSERFKRWQRQLLAVLILVWLSFAKHCCLSSLDSDIKHRAKIHKALAELLHKCRKAHIFVLTC